MFFCAMLQNYKKMNAFEKDVYAAVAGALISVTILAFCLCKSTKNSTKKRKTRKNRDIDDQAAVIIVAERKETFVRVGAETPEDKTDDPSPPLAVVRQPLRLRPANKRR